MLGWLVCLSTASQAYECDWKRGDVYYRMICSACHKEAPSGAIAPSSMTRAQWEAYLTADKHAKGKDSLKYYLSKPYRESIKGTNKAAAKFLETPDSELYEDVKAFVLRGAKDGDAPTGCR
jgi:cytochrome c5